MSKQALLVLFISVLLASIIPVTPSTNIAGQTQPRRNVSSFHSATINYTFTINETQTWNGDFVVNETDIVLIENCSFTLFQGVMWIHGELYIHNSSVLFRHKLPPGHSVFGYLYISNSFIHSPLRGEAFCGEGGDILIHNSTLINLDLVWDLSFSIFSSRVFSRINIWRRSALLYSSYVEELQEGPLNMGHKIVVCDCDIEKVYLYSTESEMQLRPGLVADFATPYLNITNSFVGSWLINSHTSGVHFLNSVVDSVLLGSLSGNVTLQSGFFENKSLEACDITMTNTTINNWVVDQQVGSVNFTDSNFSITIRLSANEVSIFNSTLITLRVGSTPANIIVKDSQVDVLNPSYSGTGSVFIDSLHEGYLDYYNLRSTLNDEPPSCWNITVINSTVNHWGIWVMRSMWYYGGSPENVTLQNCCITSSIEQQPNTNTYAGGLCLFYIDTDTYLMNCSIQHFHFMCGGQQLRVTAVNSTLQTVEHFAKSFTAINSSVGVLVTDPANMTFIDSRLECALYLPCCLQYLDVALRDNASIPLPKYMCRVSKFLNFTTGRSLEGHIRMYYAEIEGTDERNFTMFQLDQSECWKQCSIQGVNTTANYVWANVTYLSCFAVAFPSPYYPWKTSFTGLNGYPAVDFAVYNEDLYVVSDNTVSMFDGDGWSIIDAPGYMFSLESYGDRLLVGGKGGLYSYNGTAFNFVFSVSNYIKPLGVYNNTLYAGTMLDNPPTLYYCNGSAENPDNWHVDNGFSTILNFSGPFGSIDSFAVYNNKIYVSSGGTLYSYNGTGWNITRTYDDVCAYLDMKVYNGNLYLATRDQAWRKPIYQGGTGFSGRVIEFDGDNWTTVFDHDYWIFSLETYNGKLYAGTANKIYTYNGTHWETSFHSEEGAYHAISFITFNNTIYAGMGNGYIFEDPSFGTMESETMTVPEFPLSGTLLLFMMATLLAVIIYRKRPKMSKE